MANMIQMAKEQITKLVNDAYLAAAAKGELPEGLTLNGSVEIPKDTANGDYAANHAMTGAKALHMAPRKIAETLIANADLADTWFASVEVAGPGFINFRLADRWYADVLQAVTREGADYGIYTYTICPSFIKTPLVEKQIPEQARDLGITEEEVVKNIMLRDTVDGQFTTVEDVANTLVFLSKDQGALTGQSLRLTHGWAMM